MSLKTEQHYFVICLDNTSFPVALEKRKIYESIPDETASRHNQIRVIDESGEDYFYPADCFIPVNLERAVENAILGRYE